MLRRMSAPDDDLPDPIADCDALAFLDAAIGIGQAIDATAEAAEAGLVGFQFARR